MSQKHARARRRQSPPRAERVPQLVTATGPAGLLRFVPDLLAADPEDSLVLVLFRRSQGSRSRTHGAMRVDLRHAGDPDELDGWAAAVLGRALQVEGTTGVAVVAYTPETFAPSGRPPAAAQVRAAARQAERMGLEVLDRFVVAQDGWGSLDDPALPRGGRPLALLDPDRPRVRRPDPLATAAAASRWQRERFRDQYAGWWRRSGGPGGVLHDVDLRGARASRASAPGWTGPPPSDSPMDRYRYGIDVHDLVDLIEAVLEPHDRVAARPCPCRALLASVVERQGLIGMLLAQIGWGEGFGREVWTAFADPEHRQRSARRLLDALSGRFRRPDLDRIDAAIAALQETATYVDLPRITAGIDEALAWLHWARGAGTVAGALAERALTRHGDRDLAPVVLARAQRGEPPEWAFRKDAGKPDPYRALLTTPETAAG